MIESAEHVVTVRCGDQSHQGNTATVAEFYFSTDQGWKLSQSWWWKSSRSRKYATANDAASPDRRRQQRDTTVSDESVESYTRYRLECPLCGLQVTARFEKVVPILDKLKAAGIDKIELASLGAIVVNS